MRYEQRMYCETIKRLEKTAGTILFTVLAVFILLALVPMKVSGSGAGATQEEMCHELEMCFLDVLETRLTEYGYSDAGITLNSIVYSDGSRCYEVMIHHARLTDAGAEAWEELKVQVADISFPVGNCSIQYKIVP